MVDDGRTQRIFSTELSNTIFPRLYVEVDSAGRIQYRDAQTNQARGSGMAAVPRGVPFVATLRGSLSQGVAGTTDIFVNGVHEPVAAIRLDQARQHLQKRRLARAVAADKAGAHTRLDPQIDPVEQHNGPVGETDILQGDNRRAGETHGAAS